MHKKHFIEVAKMIKDLEDRKQAQYLAYWFMQFFARYNKLFDNSKFLDACGKNRCFDL